MSNGDVARLLDLLEEWERRIAAGERPEPGELAGGDTLLAEELRVAVQDLERARWLDEAEVADESLRSNGTPVGDGSLRSTSRLPFGAAASTNRGSESPVAHGSDGSTRNGSDRAGDAPGTEPSAVGRRYRILSQHAEGGLGVVYKASDREFGREVALKSVREDGTLDEVRRAKFRREAKITGCLEHPGIVPVYSLGVDDRGEPYYAMRFVQGEDLKTCLERFHATRVRNRQPLDGAELRGLLRRFLSVCDAVGYAHDCGVVHRDLKPGNIMLGEHGETLVVDWGLANRYREAEEDALEPEKAPSPLMYSDDSEKTADGTLLGTPAYAPPEQLSGRTEAISPASDVYSLGIVLYEILTGSRPVEGESLGELVAKVEAGEHLSARERLREVPAALDGICRKAYSVDPRERYASANLLKEDVEAWLDDRPVLAKPDRIADRCFRWSRRHPALAAGWSIGLIGFLLAVTVSMWIDGRRQAAVNAVERERSERREAEAAAEAERYFSGLAELTDLVSERRAGWTQEAERELAKLRRASLANKPEERVKLASAEWTASIGRELVPEPWALDQLDYQPFRAILSPDKTLLALPQTRAAIRMQSICAIADALTGRIQRRLTYFALPSATRLLDELHHPNGMRNAGFSDDGASIAVTLRYGSLLVWELGKTPDDAPIVLESGSSEAGEEVVWLKDGRSIVASFGDELHLWTREDEAFRKVASTTVTGRSSQLVREPESDRILFVVEGEVRAVDGETLESAKVAKTEWDHRLPGSGFVGFKNAAGVQVLDLADPTASFTLLPYELVRSDARVRLPSFSSDGALAVVGVESDDQCSVLLLDVASGEVLSRQKVESGNDVLPAFVDDETVLLVSNLGVSRWHVAGALALRSVAMSSRPPLDVSWAEQGTTGLVSLPGRIVTLKTSANAAVFQPRTQPVKGDWRVRVSPLGDRAALLTAADDSKCKLQNGEIDEGAGELRLAKRQLPLPQCEQAVWNVDGESVWIYLGDEETRAVGGNAKIERRAWPGMDPLSRWEGPLWENVKSGRGKVQALAATERWVLGGLRSGKLFCLRTADASETTDVRKVSEQRVLSVDASSSADEGFAGLEDGRLLAMKLPGLTTRELERYDDSVVAVDVSPDGARLLNATARGRLAIRRWDGSEWRKTLETHFEKAVVSACWVDPLGETLCVRLEHERGVRILRVPREIWNRATGEAMIAIAAAPR